MIKWILFKIFAVYIIFTVILFGIDIFYYMIDRFGRYHIGMFDSTEEWEDKVIKCGIKWLRNEPTVKISDNNRYIFLDIIRGNYRNNTIQSWQKGALILGLEEINKKEVEKSIKKVLSQKGWKDKYNNVDCGLLSYAILRNSDEQEVKAEMFHTFEIIRRNIGEDGMINYTNDPHSLERYVDTIGLTVPFLFLFAKRYNNNEAYKIGIKQLRNFAEYGLEKRYLLPNHAYDAKSRLPLGNFGWGRGCSWYVIGLIDSYYEMEDNEDRKWLENHIHEIADNYLIFQREDGGFGRIFQLRTGYDSSATSVMAYFYKRCFEIWKDEKYNDVYKKCLLKLRTVTKITGALDWCQGDTKDIGVLSQTFGKMPFAQGMLIRSLEREK